MYLNNVGETNLNDQNEPGNNKNIKNEK